MSTFSVLKMLVLTILVGSLVGCSSKLPPPTQEIAMTTAAINQAESAGAVEHAAVEMRSAREKLTQAQVAMSKEENLKALHLAKEAEADAQLAEAKSRTAKTQKAVAELQESIQTLKKEIERKTNP